MKWLGQYIQSFTARFRSDVYLEHGADLYITDATDSGDYFKIETTTHGATTLTTVDDDATAANFEIAADGNITLDSANDISLEIADARTISFVNGANTFGNLYAEDGNQSELRLNEQGGSSTADYFSILVGEHGDTTLGTVDTAASAANMKLDADGTITLDSIGGQTFSDNSGAFRFVDADNVNDYFKVDIGTNGNTTLTTVDAAAAAAHFEVAADGDITLDAAGTIKLEGPVRPTGQIQAVYSSFQANDLGTKHYLAFNDGDSENTDQANVDMPLVCPVAGKLLSVSVRQTRNQSSDTYTIRLETQAAGVAHATGPTIVATQSGSAPTNTSIVTYDFQSGLDSGVNTINAGDYVYISIESDDDPDGTTKYFFTCLFEWDYSSIT